jgi:hypothetical protein
MDDVGIAASLPESDRKRRSQRDRLGDTETRRSCDRNSVDVVIRTKPPWYRGEHTTLVVSLVHSFGDCSDDLFDAADLGVIEFVDLKDLHASGELNTSK